MLSTLSKWRILARMMYPQYIEFEEWMKASGNRSTRYVFNLDSTMVLVTNNGFGNYYAAFNNMRLENIQCEWDYERRAIFLFQKIESNIKGNESLFAPKRREPGVVD